LTRRCTRRGRWRGAVSGWTRGPLGLPAGLLTPRTIVGAVRGRQRPCVARRSRRGSVLWRRLTEAGARSFRLNERRRSCFRFAALRAGLGSRGRRRRSIGRLSRALVFLRRWATIWWDKVDRRTRGHRRRGGRGRRGLRCRGLVFGFLGARPVEFISQCVVAVGHYISPSVRRRRCRPLSSINYAGFLSLRCGEHCAPQSSSKLHSGS
jgi:hypothetical protein